jgi:hypothetical protein
MTGLDKLFELFETIEDADDGCGLSYNCPDSNPHGLAATGT